MFKNIIHNKYFMTYIYVELFPIRSYSYLKFITQFVLSTLYPPDIFALLEFSGKTPRVTLSACFNNELCAVKLHFISSRNVNFDEGNLNNMKMEIILKCMLLQF